MNLTTIVLVALGVWTALGVGFNIASVSTAASRLTGALTTFCLIAPVALFTKRGGALKRSTGRVFAKITKGLADLLEAILIGMMKSVGWFATRGFGATKQLAQNRRTKKEGI